MQFKGQTWDTMAQIINMLRGFNSNKGKNPKFQARITLQHPISLDEEKSEPRVLLVPSRAFRFTHSNNSHSTFKSKHKLFPLSFNGHWVCP